MSHCSYCDGLLVNIVTKSYIGQTYWETKHRDTAPSAGQQTPMKSGFDSHPYNSTFWNKLNSAMQSINYFMYNYSPYPAGTLHVDYWGEVGTMTWTPDWLSVSGRLVVECPPGVGHLGGCPVGEP